MTKELKKANIFAVESINNGINIPSVCPFCSQESSEETNIRIYANEVSNAGIFLFGVLGMVLRFMIGADYIDSKKVLKVNTCSHCYNLRLFYRMIEWIARIGGIVMWFVLLQIFSTPEKPLINQDISMILLCFSPIFIGAILAYIFRRLGDNRKGIVFDHAENEKIWLRVKSNIWFKDFTSNNSVLSNESTT